MPESKRCEIINISIDMFAQNGIKDISLKKIAQKSGLSRSGLYHYFRGGKKDIVAVILKMFEDMVIERIPDPEEWNSPEADVEYVLSNLFFKFEEADAVMYRKITRIIFSGMFYVPEIKEYALNHLINGRTRLLADCFSALSANGLIVPIENPESAARFFNSLIVVFALVDALSNPCGGTIDEESFNAMSGDCERFVLYLLSGKSDNNRHNPR